MGGQQELDKFARLFMVPGMGHWGGGPSPNTSELLLQMVAWVENGQAPESIVARQGAGGRGGGVALQRPVYRYPLLARYVGPDPATNPVGSAPRRRAN
jgi:feruloyl esterase